MPIAHELPAVTSDCDTELSVVENLISTVLADKEDVAHGIAKYDPDVNVTAFVCSSYCSNDPVGYAVAGMPDSLTRSVVDSTPNVFVNARRAVFVPFVLSIKI